MIGVWSSYSSAYLYVISIAILVTFGVPMLLAPIWWARLLRWTIPEHKHLATYFGRCLGGVASMFAVAAIMIAQTPALEPIFFRLMIMIFSVMTAIHIYGAFNRIQPLTETIEILIWAGLIPLTLCFYPGT